MHALELPVCSIDAEGIQQLGGCGSLRAHSHTPYIQVDDHAMPCTVHGRRCRLSFGVCPAAVFVFAVAEILHKLLITRNRFAALSARRREAGGGAAPQPESVRPSA
jgi:hypothetical protein